MEAEHVLKRRLEEVKERMEQAARNSEEIMLPVKNWLNDVEKILENVQELQQKAEKEGKSCFNVSLKYSLAKQMDNNAKRMMELKKESYFEKDHFSHLIQLPDITHFSSKDFVDFQSRESTYKDLLEAIKDEKNKMIGLCGMGGSGKTTLAKEVGKEVDKMKIFEKVIMVIVSKPPLNVTKVQQDIAEQIDLKISDQTPLARAQRLSNRLKNKKILIILDDVWEYLKLEDIGIPLVEGCQILLATRLRNVCGFMGCKTIELPLITKEEAWELFKKHANLRNDSSNMFDDIGRKIVNECKELPIAIIIVGSSLKRKPIRAWESALRD
ncbi:disease resistance protein RPS5-like [Neltuma alba]|uniref:disease resistance protein RPS5-like n=1 Tax=Neltuma alba TaxID=207710 RepID=UPI0010A3EF84|nr:disease resistance protein RPS5-like [Prosopis alba]